MKYKSYKYKLEKVKNGYYAIVPVNFTYKAIILESSKDKTIKAFKAYVDRVIHYNNGGVV